MVRTEYNISRRFFLTYLMTGLSMLVYYNYGFWWSIVPFYFSAVSYMSASMAKKAIEPYVRKITILEVGSADDVG